MYKLPKWFDRYLFLKKQTQNLQMVVVLYHFGILNLRTKLYKKKNTFLEYLESLSVVTIQLNIFDGWFLPIYENLSSKSWCEKVCMKS